MLSGKIHWFGFEAEGRKVAYRLIKFYDRLQDSFEAELGAAQCRRTVESLRTLAEAYRRKM